jgi:hypothetical protein
MITLGDSETVSSDNLVTTYWWPETISKIHVSCRSAISMVLKRWRLHGKIAKIGDGSWKKV